MVVLVAESSINPSWSFNAYEALLGTAHLNSNNRTALVKHDD